MRIGQVLLATEAEDGADHLTLLVRALSDHGVDQHVLVSNERLARELSSTDRVTVGPLTRTPIMACCLMPDVDVAHMHDLKSAQTGLLLTLTRSVPYVITLRSPAVTTLSPISRAVHQRARCIVCQSDDVADMLRRRHPDLYIECIPPIRMQGTTDARAMSPERAAAAYKKVYRRTLDGRRRPAMML